MNTDMYYTTYTCKLCGWELAEEEKDAHHCKLMDVYEKAKSMIGKYYKTTSNSYYYVENAKVYSREVCICGPMGYVREHYISYNKQLQSTFDGEHINGCYFKEITKEEFECARNGMIEMLKEDVSKSTNA